MSLIVLRIAEAISKELRQRKSKGKAIMKKRQKKGEAALLEQGVKQSNPVAIFGRSPVERIITHNERLYNRTYVRIEECEAEV